jgi:hypothetical protein
VVHPRGLARLPLEQDQLQRRRGDGEVGVAGPALGRNGVEQLRVELDRGVEVGDAECELDTGHGSSSGEDIDTRRCLNVM